MPRGFPLQDTGPGMAEMFHDLQIEQEQERAAKRELLTAPGAADLTFGSLLDFMIGCSFQRVETLAPDRKHRFYTECRCCGGTDEKRDHYKTSLSKVEHSETCGFRKHMSRLRAMANEGVT